VRVGRREALYPHRLHEQNTTEKRQKMFTALEATKYIGTVRMYHGDSLDFPVRVVDLRPRFGTIDAKVTPVGGRGTKWVELDRLGEEVA
jgi:hypothetical protein